MSQAENLLSTHQIDITAHRDHKQLAQAIENEVFVKIAGITYQLQSIDPLIFLDVLGDVSVWQPMADDAKREQHRRTLKHGRILQAWIHHGG